MKYLYFILFFTFIKFSFGQDVHFSQFTKDRMNLNPSMIGNFTDNDSRFSIQRKSQWNSVSVPFSSFSSSYEEKNVFYDFNLGIQFLNDKSGDSKLSLNQINLALSKNFNTLNLNNLSLGFLIGFSQKSIDYTELIFEYEEQFLKDNFVYPDVGIGLSYQTLPNKILSYNFGISSFHLNLPNNSFNEDENVKIPVKNNLYFGIKYDYLTNFTIIPEVLYTNQGVSNELLLGSQAEFKLDNIKIIPFTYYRLEDAIILGFGISKDNLTTNISYDINISDLDIASNNRGGFEFSVIFLWQKRKEHINKITEEICPKYL
ncbi:MAG: hypothetical protein CMD02_06295 [Flavobacteriales bacterium]|nr:hypothetical protein [Flavobacteriales bacterium]